MRQHHFRYQTFKSVLFSLITVITLTGCYSTEHFTPKKIVIETTPEASVYWLGGTHDGRYIQTANNEGVATARLSEYEYRKDKAKKVLIAKEGYEPVELKLATKFNSKVLRNLLFPPALLWGKYSTLDPDKKNRRTLSVPARHTATEYFESAQQSKGKQRIELLKQALYQDPVNKQGVGKLAAGMLSDIYYDRKEYNAASEYAATMLRMSPRNDDGKDKLNRANLAIQEKVERKLRRQARFNKFGQKAQAFSTALAANTAAMNGNSSTDFSQGSSSVTSQSSKSNKNTKSTSVGTAQNERLDRRSYDNYVDQLSRMKTGLDTYNDANRRNIQSKMKELRQRWGFPMNELENWNGSK